MIIMKSIFSFLGFVVPFLLTSSAAAAALDDSREGGISSQHEQERWQEEEELAPQGDEQYRHLQQVSDAPSDIATAAVSYLPTDAPDGGEGGKGDNGSESKCRTARECGRGECLAFESAAELGACVNSIDGQGRLCLCPFLLSETAGNCPEPTSVDEEEDPSAVVVVSQGQDITLECDSEFGRTFRCVFACPNAAVDVKSGAKFALEGNGITEFTGGVAYSRITVEAGGEATIRGTSFKSTAVSSAGDEGGDQQPGRQLVVSRNGVGGGIENLGVLTVQDSSFEDCTAEVSGGAIFTSGEAVVEESTFSGNSAPRGGAIFAEGTLLLVNSTFVDNAASVQGKNVDGPGAQITACGNTGYRDVGGSCGGGDFSSALETFGTSSWTTASLVILLATVTMLPYGV